MDYKSLAAERRERTRIDLETEKVKQLKRIADSLDTLLNTVKEGTDIENCKRFLQPTDVWTDG